ncbi:SpaA isopeptide-forming pilin-related protein [Anaerococcus sp. Marseille-P9784]|uniref:SpaA isopeptide-forming pilin-related protein n=1 Tax=Anaerococcus sp. Marseille-P9784 TaxID=2614127 RepID=UPI00124A279F|nr:SpaA isopeptide-forming pilin-related protein [Anaerococcus sp. Marseille-P9784]
MRKRIRQAMIKLLSLVLVIILTFPSEIVAQSLNGEQREIYTKDSSLMGVTEKDEDPNSRDNSAQNEKTLLQSDILKENLEKLDIEKSVSLSKTTGEIIYKILIKAKDENNLSNLQTIFALNKNSKQNDLHIQKITSFDKNGNEVEIDAKENKPFFQRDEIKTLSSTCQVEGNLLLYYLSSKIDDKTLEEIRAGENYQFALDLLIKNENQEILHQERLAFRNIDKSKENILDPENLEISEKENQDLDFDLEFIDDIFQVAGQYKDNSKNLLSDKTNEINWTDFIFPKYDENNEALNYKLIVDENQDTTDSLIRVDFYEASDEGFLINKTYSQEIPYTEETELQIPQGFIAKIALTTKVKEGANPKEFSYNNKIIANPSYKEENEKTDEENKTEEKSEDPLPEENKEENKEAEKKENSDKKENPEKTEKEEEKPSDSEEEKENQTSPIDLNKDALINKYQSEEKLSDQLKVQIEEITKTLNSYNEEKISEEEFKINLKENSKDLNKEELKEILQSLIAGLNEEKFKVANLPIDEIIGYIYKEDSKEEKEKTNLEKADQELKSALADEKKTIEEIQNLLTSLGEKYQLSREDQEKLMSDNNDAILALVGKDRNENYRPQNLMKSDSFANKQFNLKAQMNVVASDKNPIPTGWYFDVEFGPYLYYSENQPLNDLFYTGLGLVATAEYHEDGLNHYIRYTFVKPVEKTISLDIDQNLKFDTDNIGSKQSVNIDIKVAPKNNPVQSMPTKTVKIDDDSPVSTDFVIKDQGQSSSKRYPYQLAWETTSTLLKDNKGNVITTPDPTRLNGAYVEWDIKVNTSTLLDQGEDKLDFNNLNLTIFGSSQQGLRDFRFKASKNESDLNTTAGYTLSNNMSELLSQSTSIKKADLGNYLYIKVKALIDPDHPHETYSIGLRINPDSNYIKSMLDEFIGQFNKIPTPIKWLRGIEDAQRFAEVPFNLVESKIPARVNLKDNFTNERFFYDTSRTIVAERINDSRVDWHALDLLRFGETKDLAFEDPNFYLNGGTNNQSITPRKLYYVPLKSGGYRQTGQINDVLLDNGDFYPGTIIAYEYSNQAGSRNDSFYLNANITEKKVNNFDASFNAPTTGGNIDLFTEKVSDEDLANNYIAYHELPYPIMRINKNFDMVQCFNSGIPDPGYKGKNGIFLDIHENPSGDYLISRLNEKILSQGNPGWSSYTLEDKLAGTNPTRDGINLNPGGQSSKGTAMESLMKRIYYYGNEIKKEYPSSHNGKEMHRLIENAMYQKVLHYYTDGKELTDDYFSIPSNYNTQEWKVPYTLTGRREAAPKTGYIGQYEGDNTLPDRYVSSPDKLRKLKDNEEVIGSYPPVADTQLQMAEELNKRVINSYKNGSDWSNEKADLVKLVFYSHIESGKYQELMTGRVSDPIQIDKYKEDGKTKLKDAIFTFTNIYTNEKRTWTSTDTNDINNIYLKPGYYRVTEEAPATYEAIKPFTIEVKREEVNGDSGNYDFFNLKNIRVNDGYKTTLELKDVPKSAKGTPLVEIDPNNKLKIKVINIQDNLGKIEFIKKNKFIKLDGAEFTLRKLKSASSAEDAKNQAKEANPAYDEAYHQISSGDGGEFKFEQIPAGYYILEETKAPAGYQKAKRYVLEAKNGTDPVDGKEKVLVNFVDTDLEKEYGKVVIKNNPKETKVTFRKVREEFKNDEENEHLGLPEAKFRLTSLKMIDGDTYLQEDFTDKTQKTEAPTPTIDNQQAKGGGYIEFNNLKIGEYLLQEIQAPKGYQPTALYGWKLVVSEIKEGENKGELEYKLYEVPKEKDINSPLSDLTEIHLKQIIKESKTIQGFLIGNEPRKISIPFSKYLSDGGDAVPASKKLVDENNEDVKFNLYEADYYGAILDENHPINKEPIIQNISKASGARRDFTDSKYDYSFELHDLEFGHYYVLREVNPPVGYIRARRILLKVEAEAIASEGHMKVIVRDTNPNTKYGEHAIFEGVINFHKGTALGEFSIKKVGNAIGFNDDDGNPIRVGLRRAYFRLYTADDNYNIKRNAAGFPEEYIQKVTPGNPITEPDGHGGQQGVDPNDPTKIPPNQGIVTFDQLKPGKYVLEEYRGPAGYEKDPNPWYILVEADGTVKKYKDNPATNTGARTMDYSPINTRFKMSGLSLVDTAKGSSLLSLSEPLANSPVKAKNPGTALRSANDWEDVNPANSEGRANIEHSNLKMETRITEINKVDNRFRQVFLFRPQGRNYARNIQIHRQPENGEFRLKNGKTVISTMKIYEVGENSTLDNITGTKTDITNNIHPSQYTPPRKPGETQKPQRVSANIPTRYTGAILVEIETSYPSDTAPLGLGSDYNYNTGATYGNKAWAGDSYDNEAGINKNNLVTYNVSYAPMAGGSVSANPSENIKEGTEVSLTANPQAGFKLDSITVINDKTGENITLTADNKFFMPASDVTISASFSQIPVTTYNVRVMPANNGSVIANPSINVSQGSQVILTVSPNQGYRLQNLSVVDSNGNDVPVNNNTFNMPASDVTVTPTFEQIPVPTANVDVKVNFTYHNQTDGNDTSNNPPQGFAGSMRLQEKQMSGMVETWVDVAGPPKDVPFKGSLDFNGLDSSKEYRLVYTRDGDNGRDWGTNTVSNYPLDFTKADANNKLTLEISNGNLTEIFNHDETGFRIPLRVTKVNENLGALTGSQFKARKLIDGEKADKYIKNADGTYTNTHVKELPKYATEPYDQFSEATGEPGDNYFRELSPGIYELTETQAPDGSYRLPKDKDGKDMKWYFKVYVQENKIPRDANYMNITFNFTHTFSANDKFNSAITNEERNKLIGTTIKGFQAGDPDFSKYIEEIPDDGRSNPARPDAPYKGIHDARVTNYKNKTELRFFKKDKENYQNLKGAVFSLRKAKVDSAGNPVFDANNKAQYDPNASTEEEKRVEPFDESAGFAKSTSNDRLGVHFKEIEEGTYILEELTPPDGYAPIDAYLTIKFTEATDGSWKQVVTGYKLNPTTNKYEIIQASDSTIFTTTNDGKLTSIANDKNLIDFKFQKVEGTKVNGKYPEIDSSDFELVEVDNDGKEIEGGYKKTLYSYANPNFSFEGLAFGRYKLTEKRAIEKYEKPSPWFFKVDQDPKTYKLKIVFENPDASVKFNQDTDGNPKDIKIANYQKINFVFKKKNQDDKPLVGVYFDMKKLEDLDGKKYEYVDGVSSATSAYYDRARSQNNGAVTFFKLGTGVYELHETTKPEGYDSSTNQDRWIIKIVKGENGLEVKYDKKFEGDYYQEHDNDYYTNTYIAKGFDKKNTLEKLSTPDADGFSYTLTNTKNTVDLKWKKYSGENKDDLIESYTKFILIKNSKDGNDVDSAKSGQSSFAPYEVDSTNGVFEIKDLAQGVYTLIEIQAPEGYKIIEDRKIVIQVYEEKDTNGNYKLKKKFYEMKKDANGKNVLVEANDFKYLLNRNQSGNIETHVDPDGSIFIKNDAKASFPLSKGFLKDPANRKEFININSGKLVLRLTQVTDTNPKVFTKTINLSGAKSYKFEIDGVKSGETYLLEELKSPDGYKKTSNKYKLYFNQPQGSDMTAILKAVIKPDGTELKNAAGKSITETGEPIGGGITISPVNEVTDSELKIVNDKAEIEFTKVGREFVKGEDGTINPKDTELKDVRFYLEKQDPDQVNTYYPVTRDMEFIKTDGEGKQYIEKADGTKDYGNIQKPVSTANSAYYETSKTDGKFSFTGLTDGYYQVIEPEAPSYAPGKKYMEVDGPVKKFRVVDGAIKITTDTSEESLTDTNREKLTTIANTKPGNGEFDVEKVDENGQGLDGVTYELYDSEGKKVREITTQNGGKIKFDGLAFGSYWLKETKTKDGYVIDRKLKQVLLGKNWEVPTNPTSPRDVTNDVLFDLTKSKELKSIGGETSSTSEVKPNQQEAILAYFNLKVKDGATVKSGDTFTIDFSDNVDLFGIFVDKDGKGKEEDQTFNLYSDLGLVAKAKVDPNKRKLTYTFTEYLDNYKLGDMKLSTQLYVDRKTVPQSDNITVTATAGNTYSDSIYVNYRGDTPGQDHKGYQDPKVDISSYMLRLNPDNGEFTTVVYYNPWNKYTKNRWFRFITSQPVDIKNVKVFRKSGDGSNKTSPQTGDLPDSYGIKFDDDLANGYKAQGLSLVANKTQFDYKYGNTNKDYGMYLDYYNNNDSTYVVVIQGQLKNSGTNNVLQTSSYYNMSYDAYKGHSDLQYWYHGVYGVFYTWSQFYKPEGTGSGDMTFQFANYPNKIEFVKVNGGVISNAANLATPNSDAGSLKGLGIGSALKGAKFKLQKATGILGGYEDVDGSERTSDANGIFSWQGLTPGKYLVIETQTADETYDLPRPTDPKEPIGLISSFEVDANGNITKIKNDKNILENNKKAEIRIRKTNEKGEPLAGVKFFLEAQDRQDYDNPTITTKADGIAEFKNLPAGTYRLREMEAPKGYKIPDEDTYWEIKVTRDGKVKLTNTFSQSYNDMKEIETPTYTGQSTTSLDSQIVGLNPKNKTFRQIITLKAKPSELKNKKIVLESHDSSTKLTEANTKVLLVASDDGTNLADPDNTTYKLEINNPTSGTPNLGITITAPYKDDGHNPVGQAPGTTTPSTETERYYKLIVDMPYKEKGKVGAKVIYNEISVDQSGNITTSPKETLDKYVADSSKITVKKTNLSMETYKGKYLARDINLITTEIANIKNPDVYFEKVDEGDTTIKLKGAIFGIQEPDGEKVDEQGKQIWKNLKKDGKDWTVTSADKGLIKFEGLEFNKKYRIVEIKAPIGYINQKIEIEFMVDINGKLVITKSAGEKEKYDNSESNPYQITNKKATYPQTGGPGVWIGFSLIGLAVMITGVLIYGKRKQLA